MVESSTGSERKLLLTVQEASAVLGVSRSFLYTLIQRGQLVSICLGKARRIPVAALDDFIAARLREQAADQWAETVGLSNEGGSHE